MQWPSSSGSSYWSVRDTGSRCRRSNKPWSSSTPFGTTSSPFSIRQQSLPRRKRQVRPFRLPKFAPRDPCQSGADLRTRLETNSSVVRLARIGLADLVDAIAKGGKILMENAHGQAPAYNPFVAQRKPDRDSSRDAA